MSKKLHFLKPAEAAAIAAVLIVCVSAAIIMKRTDSGGKMAVIRCGELEEVISLDSDGMYSFNGIDAVFEVRDGKIRVNEAHCPDKICEKTGYIGSEGESIICVPKKIIVTVSGIESGADAEIG